MPITATREGAQKAPPAIINITMSASVVRTVSGSVDEVCTVFLVTNSSDIVVVSVESAAAGVTDIMRVSAIAAVSFFILPSHFFAFAFQPPG